MLKKILTILSTILLIILILVGLLFFISILPVKDNIKILSVMSGSMEPNIKTGSLILIKPNQNYLEGDVITFVTPAGKSAKDYTTHRIYKINNSIEPAIFTTKGDANNTPDGWIVKHNDIIGKQYVTVPYLGYLITYIKTLPGLIIIIIIPAVIIIYEEIKKLKVEAKAVLEKRKAKKRAKKSEAELLNGSAPDITEPLVKNLTVMKKTNETSATNKSANGKKGKGAKNDTKN